MCGPVQGFSCTEVGVCVGEVHMSWCDCGCEQTPWPLQQCGVSDSCISDWLATPSWVPAPDPTHLAGCLWGYACLACVAGVQGLVGPRPYARGPLAHWPPAWLPGLHPWSAWVRALSLRCHRTLEKKMPADPLVTRLEGAGAAPRLRVMASALL